jgi:hypothetical protein
VFRLTRAKPRRIQLNGRSLPISSAPLVKLGEGFGSERDRTSANSRWNESWRGFLYIDAVLYESIAAILRRFLGLVCAVADTGQPAAPPARADV